MVTGQSHVGSTSTTACGTTLASSSGYHPTLSCLPPLLDRSRSLLASSNWVLPCTRPSSTHRPVVLSTVYPSALLVRPDHDHCCRAVQQPQCSAKRRLKTRPLMSSGRQDQSTRHRSTIRCRHEAMGINKMGVCVMKNATQHHRRFKPRHSSLPTDFTGLFSEYLTFV